MRWERNWLRASQQTQTRSDGHFLQKFLYERRLASKCWMCTASVTRAARGQRRFRTWPPTQPRSGKAAC
jgi:hypothetical protein